MVCGNGRAAPKAALPLLLPLQLSLVLFALWQSPLAWRASPPTSLGTNCPVGLHEAVAVSTSALCLCCATTID
jgi:hypothetical protein